MHLRTRRTLRTAAVALTALLAAPALAGGDGWITDDMPAALEQAKAEGKHVLVDFTGSDWCGWCIKLDNEVFSQSLFKEEAPKQFVLLELDYPRSKPQTEEVKKANAELAKKYQIQGYPTILLTDADGNAWARSGYRPGGAAPYMDHLNGLVKAKKTVDAALAKAADAEGAAKAKLLDQAVSAEDIIVKDRDKLVDQIIALDAEDAAGLRSKWTQIREDEKVRAELASIGGMLMRGDYDGAAAKLDHIEAHHTISDATRGDVLQNRIMVLNAKGETEAAMKLVEGILADESNPLEMRQQMSAMRINVYLEAGEFDKAIEAFEATIAMDPKSEFGTMLSNQKQMFLDYVKQQRGG